MHEVVEEEVIDVPVPVVFRQWSRFKEFPQFIDSVHSITPLTDVIDVWSVKIGPVERTFDAKITSMTLDESISWVSNGGQVTHRGRVDFHPEGDDARTRVVVRIEWEPEGAVDRLADSAHVVNRMVRRSLSAVKKHLEAP